jgi:hypothetical protein
LAFGYSAELLVSTLFFLLGDLNYGLALTHEPFCDLWYWHEAVAAHFCPAGILGIKQLMARC